MGENDSFFSGIDTEMGHGNTRLGVKQKREPPPLPSFKLAKKKARRLAVQYRDGNAGGQVRPGLFQKPRLEFLGEFPSLSWNFSLPE